MELRTAAAPDIDFILSVEAIPGHAEMVGRFSAAEHQEKMARADHAYLIALAEGRPLGFAVTRAGDPGSGTVCLHRIAVAETGAGIGSRFLALLCDRVFEDADIDRLWLNVLPVNHGARHVYARTGFREEGYLRKALRRPDGRREDLILMAMLREDRSQPG